MLPLKSVPTAAGAWRARQRPWRPRRSPARAAPVTARRSACDPRRALCGVDPCVECRRPGATATSGESRWRSGKVLRQAAEATATAQRRQATQPSRSGRCGSWEPGACLDRNTARDPRSTRKRVDRHRASLAVRPPRRSPEEHPLHLVGPDRDSTIATLGSRTATASAGNSMTDHCLADDRMLSGTSEESETPGRTREDRSCMSPII